MKTRSLLFVAIVLLPLHLFARGNWSFNNHLGSYLLNTSLVTLSDTKLSSFLPHTEIKEGFSTIKSKLIQQTQSAYDTRDGGEPVNPYTTNQPYISLTSSRKGGKWQFTLSTSKENRGTAWADLNNNGAYDKGEEKIVWDRLWRPSRTNEQLTIYGTIEFVSCSLNDLTALDVTHNKSITTLGCRENNISQLDLSQNVNLENLYCAVNELQSLDLSGCPNLKELYANDNKLTSINVKSCSKLTEFCVNRNQLTSIDCSKNEALSLVLFDDNQLTQILFPTTNTTLQKLPIKNNLLNTLDVNGLVEVDEIHCYNNAIAGDDAKNFIASLPSREGKGQGVVFFIDTEDSNEKNMAYKTDVAIASAKNWIFYDIKGGLNNGQNLYEGKPNANSSLTRATLPFTLYQKRMEITSPGVDPIIFYSIQGECLLETYDSSIDLSAFPNGTYLVLIHGIAYSFIL